jgi:clan AA aspartic protease
MLSARAVCNPFRRLDFASFAPEKCIAGLPESRHYVCYLEEGYVMGLIKARISLSNPRDRCLGPIHVDALADTGSLHLCVPEHIAIQLKVEELYKREVTTADGRKQLCSYVGPIEVKFQNRGCYTGALVLGDEVLLGAVPMEDMDILLSPAKQAVIVNPDSPNIATSIVK